MNVTERLHILIHISNYFQTLEVMEKTLSHKNDRIKSSNDQVVTLKLAAHTSRSRRCHPTHERRASAVLVFNNSEKHS